MTVTFATIHLLGGIDFEVSFAQWFANRSSSRPLSANPFRKMSCSDSAAILVPLGRISQEHSNRPAFMSSNEDGIGLDMWRTVVKQAAANWSSHKDARQGAALAYYSVFSLGPIIVIAITIAGLLFGQAAVVSEVMSAIREMLGDTGAKAVEAMLAGASRPAAGILATILGIGALLFAAIGVVVQQKGALNVVWDVEESEESGLWHFARNYVLSLAAVLALGFLLLVSLLVSAGLAAAGKYAATYVPEAALHVGSMLISFLVVMVLFAMMFKWLPDVTIGWEDVWLGAFLIALFFEIGKAGIGFYIGKQGLESTYGAAASIVVVLIWVYYTSQIILMGAEVTHSYARNNGSLKQRDPETCLAGDDDRTERSYPGTNGDRNKRSSNIPA